MPRIYHKFHFCGGEVVEKRVTVDYRWGENLIALIKNVPTGDAVFVENNTLRQKL